MFQFNLSGNQWFDQLAHPVLLVQNGHIAYLNPAAQHSLADLLDLTEGAPLPPVLCSAPEESPVLLLGNCRWQVTSQSMDCGTLYQLQPITKEDSFSPNRIVQLAQQLRMLMSPLLPAVDMLRRSIDWDTQSRSAVSLCHIDHSTHKLLRLTNNLAFYAEPEESLLETYPASLLDLSDLCDELESILTWTSEQVHLHFTYVDRTQGAPVLMNEPLFRKLIYNLVVNSFHAKGDVTMTLTRTRQNAVIQLSDTAGSFDPEKLSVAFEPFAERDTSFTTVEGFGLGLPICSKIARLYNGTLLLNTSSTGSLITLTFPICKPSQVRQLRSSTIYQPESSLNQVLTELSDILPATCYRDVEME